MAQKRIYTHDEVVNTLVGEKGSAKRESTDFTHREWAESDGCNNPQSFQGSRCGCQVAYCRKLDGLELDCLQLNIEELQSAVVAGWSLYFLSFEDKRLRRVCKEKNR